MTNSEMDRMAREGKTIAQISRELGMEYWEVWSQVRGWRGTKWMITNRLRRLATENDQATREKLANEADESVKYLYNEGQRLSSKVDRIRKALNS